MFKEIVVIGGLTIAAVAGATALGWFGTENQLRLSAHYAPKFEEVRRTTFEQSQTYVEGQRRDIVNLRNDYLGANNPAQKAAIRATALQRIAGLPEAALSSDILTFRATLMGDNR